MKKILFLLVLTFAVQSGLFAKKDTVTVGKGFLKKIISLVIKGKGGYQGNCVSMKVKNTGTDSILLFVEAGRRLDSKDSSMQDILVVKDLYIPLAAAQEQTFDVYGFCCQAHNKAPADKSDFSVGEIASKELLDLARYINTSRLSAGSIQQAVWVVSDNNELSSVVDDGSEAVADLRRFLSKQKNIEMPWYNTFYKQGGQEVFSGKPEKITGKIDYYVQNDLTMVMASIRDEAGTIVKTFVINKQAMRGNYTFDLNWDVKGMPMGNYTIRVTANQAELKKLPVKVK